MILKFLNQEKDIMTTEEIKKATRQFVADNKDSVPELFRRLDEYTGSRTGSDDPMSEILKMANRVRAELINDKKTA